MAEKKQEEKPKKGNQRIYRSKSERIIAGVCGGTSEYFGIDATLIRVLWVAAVLFGGFGLLAYVLCWIIIPDSPDPAMKKAAPEGKKQNLNLLWGVALIVFGAFFLLRRWDWFDYYPFHMRWHWNPFWFWHDQFSMVLPIALIIIGAFYIYTTFKKEKQSELANSEATDGGKKMENSVKKLTRSSSERMIGGVCGGLAAYFNIDPSFVRIAFALLTLAGGGLIGVAAYVIMLFVVPEDTKAAAESSRTAAEPSGTAAKPAGTAAKPSGSAAKPKRTAKPKPKPKSGDADAE